MSHFLTWEWQVMFEEEKMLTEQISIYLTRTFVDIFFFFISFHF